MKVGDCIVIGDTYARAYSYDSIVGQVARIRTVSSYDVQVSPIHADNPFELSWHIHEEDALPLMSNAHAIALLKDYL